MTARTYLLLISMLILQFTSAQSVAISDDASTPHSSAILDVKSTSKGMLIPRMTQAQREAVANPIKGLLVFQSDNIEGFYFYTGPDGWTQLGAMGPQGPQGAQGIQGVTGAQGPSGPPGPAFVQEYAYCYRTSLFELEPDEAIPFSFNGHMSSGFSHSAGSSQIICNSPGLYKIEFTVTPSLGGRAALRRNGSILSTSTYSNINGGQITGMTLVQLFNADILELVNSGDGMLNGAVGTIGNLLINASIMITKIRD